MTRIREIKTTFTAGEVSPELLGRGDLRAYNNGALTLQNVFIKPTGGVTRRSGLGFIDSAAGDGKLIAFEFNTQQTYLLVITDGQIDIYAGGVKDATVVSPWSAAQISQIAWTQSADTLLMVHRDVSPKKLTRGSGGTWSLDDWSFFTDGNIVNQPHFKFAGAEVTLTPSGTTGSITLTSSADVFAAGHEGTRMRVNGKEVEITDFDSPTVVTVDVIEDLPDTNATIDWFEQGFSAVRGYPVSVAFHQDRLVIGGSRDLPNRLWFSKSGDLFNFNLGTGLDDEAIEFAILSDQVNAIRGIFSGRHLQVFTSGAEWMVTGDPLTPASVQIRRQTRIGSVLERHIPPVNVDGATFYIARNKQEIHEFLYTDIEQAYQSTDLSLLSRHVISNPVDQDYDQRRRLLFIVRDDGKFATLTVFRSEQVSAWTLHETQGAVKSVAIVGDDVFMLTQRDGNFMIEQFDDELNLDSALTGEVITAATNWAGLDHLEGLTVSVVADGQVQANKTVSGGAITIDEAASTVEIGLSYTHIIEPLPPSEIGAAGGGRKVRLVEGIYRLQDTAALRLDVGRGLNDIALRQLGEDEILDSPPPLVSGDIRVRALGWQEDSTKPLWRIEQDVSLPFTLLAVTTELKVND
ncbi:MAG: phage protein [Micavibrio sp.]|nr:MAG: phage protein [Micavibrio sp.]